MNLSIVEARARRNGLITFAGGDYRDSCSTLLKSMIRDNKKVYFGIESSDGIYTVLGTEKSISRRRPKKSKKFLITRFLKYFKNMVGS